MFDFEPLKRNAQWAALCGLAAAVGLVLVFAPHGLRTIELRREALAASEHLQRDIAKSPDLRRQDIEVAPLASNLTHALDQTSYGHRLFRYEIYDASGRLLFVSEKQPPGGGMFGQPVRNPPAQKAGVAIQSGNGTSAPLHYALLTIPIALPHGTPRGTLVAYLDQSDQARVLSDYFGLIAGMTLIMLGGLVAAPIAFAWLRSRERRETQAHLRYLESHDTLTGLPNRRSFTERLADALVRMHRERTHIAVLCLDVDNFKDINDCADHSGGDAVLREMASRIQSAVREGDLVARLAGDEFVIALVDITNLGNVMAFMTRLVEALRPPFRVGDKEITCTSSIGVALAPGDGDSAATVLKHAAIALTRAKRDGGQRMCFFEQSMDRALQRRRLVEQELRLALTRDEFDVVYQPEYDLTSETQCAAEALIRWHHPVHGKIAPAHFISVAEDTGLIVPLGEWVLRRACSDAVLWEQPLTVAVNLSPAQFRDGDIAETVAAVLQETGLPPHRLELEITESLLISDTEEVVDKLTRLRKLGVSIAMDDFGTGYSSLSYLARFPFNKIKIDKSFVRSMTQDPVVSAIVKTIIALGRSLNVTITAEGVETEEQAKLLRDYGCLQAQGFLYGYPAAFQPSDRAQPPRGHAERRSSAA